MNSTLEKLPHCISALTIQIPPDRVGNEREKIVKQYLQHAQLPGYRAGKAPRMIVEAKFKQKIESELEEALLSSGVRDAIKEHNLQVLGVQAVEDVKREPNGPLTFTAKVITAPEFELPDYEHITVQAPNLDVAEKEVEDALERLRQRLADFEDVEARPLEITDFGVLDVAGKLDDKPLSESIEGNPGRELQGRDNFWLKLGEGNFLPGFCEAIVGMNPGETREFAIELPMDFPVTDLQARKIDYTVKLREIKKQALPPIDDDFAAKVAPGKTLAELRDLVRADLEKQKANFIDEGKRRQVVDYLNRSAEFELPQHMIRNEAQRIASDIVRENQERGVKDDQIMENQKEIAASAQSSARERLKSAFILTRIAVKDGIKVTREEMNERITALAVRYSTSFDRMRKDLEERDALSGLEEELLIAKTLAHVTAAATVQPLELPTVQPA